MHTNISDAQHSTLIGIVARIPVEAARRTFLERIETALPAQGRISEAQLTDAVNNALASFKPGQWHGDAQGVFPRIDENTPLGDLATLYVRVLREQGSWWWPPLPPRQSMTEAQPGEAYARTLFAPEAEAKRYDEIVWDPTQPPPAKPPVVEVMPEPTAPRAKAKDDVATSPQDDEEPPSPWFSDWGAPGKDNRGRPVSAYGEASEVLKRKGKRRLRGRLGDKMKVFFK